VLYQSVAQRIVLAVPGFFVLGLRFVRRHRDPLALGAAFNLVVYIAGYAIGHENFGRVLSGIMIMAQVAMGIYVAERIFRWTTLTITTRHVTTIAVVAIVVLGAIGSAKGAIRVVPRSLLPARYSHNEGLASLVSPYESLSRFIARDDVVVASPTIALAVAASSGKVIPPPAPAPFVDDLARRQAAVYALLSPKSSWDQFRSLIREYAVKWFVVTPSDAQRLRPRIQDNDLQLVDATTQLRVYRVDENRAP
jgi:hypothetical protein